MLLRRLLSLAVLVCVLSDASAHDYKRATIYYFDWDLRLRA